MQRLQALTRHRDAAPAPVLAKAPADTRSSAQTLAQVIDVRRFGRPMNKRAEFRHGHFMNNAVVRTVGGEAEANIVNVSEGGMMLQCQCPPDEGEMVLVFIDGIEPLEGCVAWRQGSRFGVDLGAQAIDLIAMG